MWRSRALAVLAAAVVVLSGCEMSQVGPDAEIKIGGTLVGSDGVPITDSEVVLLTEPTLGDVVFGLPFGLASLGFACLVEDPPPPCDTRRRASTDDEGRFAFTVTGRETQGLLGGAARMTLSGDAPSRGREISGPAVTGAFIVRTEQVDLEPLTAVRGDLSLSADDGRAQVDWAWQTDALRGAPSAPDVVFEQGVHPTWVAPAGGTGIDLRVLEQPSGTVSVVEQRRADGTVDDLTYRSEVLPYVSGAGAPTSRSAACEVVGSDGSQVPVAPCPVTDGDLVEVVAAEMACDDAACAEATGYVIDLGTRRPVELLVVRGCEDSCPVEVSTDAASWELVAEVTDPHATVARDGTPVQYVRVSGDAGIHGLAEVSAWDGPPAEQRFALAPAASPTTGSGAGEPEGGAAGGTGSGAGWPWWLAAVLLVLAAGGTGVAIGRRSRGQD